MNSEKEIRFVLRFLRWFCPDHLQEEIEGDLMQRFNRDLKSLGLRKARRRLFWNTLKFFRPGILLRNKFSPEVTRLSMIQSYTKIGIRHLAKRKLYTFINTFGLAIGIAVCLVIWRYAEFELSYDSFHTKANNIYRLKSTLYTDQEKIPHVGYDLAPALMDEIPGIKRFVRVHPMYDQEGMVTLFSDKGERRNFRERNIQFADSTFFHVFSFDFISGDSATALNNPFSVVITESIAHKYFPDDVNPIGKTLRLSGGLSDGDYQVTAVIRDVPQNSHLTFDFLFPAYNLIHSEFYHDRPRWNGFFTYLEFDSETSIERVQEKMPGFIERYQGNTLSSHKAQIEFEPLLSIHSSGAPVSMGETDKRGDIPVYFFLIISVFVLCIALINYINLSTARAMERAKEIGIKKAFGVLRKQLIGQFIFESMLINIISMIIGVFLAALLLPLLSVVVTKTIRFDFDQPDLWIILIGIFLTGSLLAGAYPAFFLSSFKTIRTIRGYQEKLSQGFSLRKALVVFQFSASTFLLAGTFTINRQIEFMRHHDKGMRTDQMLIITGPKVANAEDKTFTGFRDRAITFKNEVLKLPAIVKVATSEVEPGGGHNWETHMYRLGALENEIIPGENMNVVFTDTDLVDTYGLELISGSVWDPNKVSDMGSVLINEAAIGPFGLKDPESALHEKLVSEIDTVEIIGVLKNFHWQSLKVGYEPMVLWPEQIAYQRFSVLLNGDVKNALGQIETLYSNFFPGNSFDYYFLDDSFNQQYRSDRQMEKIFGLFALLAIIIACLGLFGLASFATTQRSKEISIRKVLGASVVSLMSLLSVNFLRLVLIASILTLPITWFVTGQWLENYAFRIDFSWKLYIIPVVSLMVIALSTIAFQVLKAAIANPVVGLRSE